MPDSDPPEGPAGPGAGGYANSLGGVWKPAGPGEHNTMLSLPCHSLHIYCTHSFSVGAPNSPCLLLSDSNRESIHFGCSGPSDLLQLPGET